MLNQLRLSAHKRPLLMSRFFRSMFHLKKPRVFLCGPKLQVRKTEDIRCQIQDLLKEDFSCKPILGEEIEELRLTTDRDHLTIEVEEANRSDIIVILLSSPGAISELTAFALNDTLNKKLLVINEEQFRESDSFINRGPLKLIDPEQLVYYDKNLLDAHEKVLTYLDLAVSKYWFSRLNQSTMLYLGNRKPMNCLEFLTLSSIHALYPIKRRELITHLKFFENERAFSAAIKSLHASGLIQNLNHRYIPTRSLQSLHLPEGLIFDNARLRLRLISSRLSDVELRQDFLLPS